jgi:hypothetical protein
MLANLIRRRQAKVEWQHHVIASIAKHLRESLSTPRHSRDARITQLILDEHDHQGDRRYAFGDDAPFELIDWLRFAILRARTMTGLGLDHTDKYAWLARDALLITDVCGDRAVAQYVHAEANIPELPHIERMPPWMYRPPAP